MIFVMIIAGIYLSSLHSSFVGWKAMFNKKLPKSGTTIFRGLVIFFKMYDLVALFLSVVLIVQRAGACFSKGTGRWLLLKKSATFSGRGKRRLGTSMVLLTLIGLAGQTLAVAAENEEVRNENEVSFYTYFFC